MTGGRVLVADDGSVSGDGLALAIFGAMSAWTLGTVAPSADLETVVTLHDGTRVKAKTNVLRHVAGQCNALAPAIVDYLKTNAVVDGGSIL